MEASSDESRHHGSFAEAYAVVGVKGTVETVMQGHADAVGILCALAFDRRQFIRARHRQAAGWLAPAISPRAIMLCPQR